MMLGQTQQQSTCGGGRAPSSPTTTASVMSSSPYTVNYHHHNSSSASSKSPNHSPAISPLQYRASPPATGASSAVGKCQSVYSSIEKLLATSSTVVSSPPSPPPAEFPSGAAGYDGNVLSGMKKVECVDFLICVSVWQMLGIKAW